MTPATQKDRHHASDDPAGDRATGRLSVIGGANPVHRAHAVPEPIAHQGEPTLIVRLPATPGRAPAAPPVAAKADLQVKRYHGGAANDERYTATLLAASATPAALLAALAAAASQIEDLARAGSPDDQVILNIAIRR